MEKVVGIDEAGRGAWAGPLVAAAVTWPSNQDLDLADSKALSSKQRAQKAIFIEKVGLQIGLGWVSASDLDRFGLTQGQKLAMEQAWRALADPSGPVIIDGPINYLKDVTVAQAIVRADSLVPAVMAASIIAKVYRDRFMIYLDKKYPNYKLGDNKGYGTKAHQEALDRFGFVEGLHRQSYKPVAKTKGNPRRA